MFNNPAFGIFLTMATYYVGTLVYSKTKHPILNPLMVGLVLTILVLLGLRVSYEDYMIGGSIIQFLIMPASIVLVVPLYKNWKLFTDNLKEIVLGTFVGSVVAVGSIFLMSKIFGINREVLISLLPKSITTAIALPLSEEYGGIISLTAFAISITGISGTILCDPIFKLLKLKDPTVRGVALGTSAHAIGTSKALEYGEADGAISGLCILLAGLITVILFAVLFLFY